MQGHARQEPHGEFDDLKAWVLRGYPYSTAQQAYGVNWTTGKTAPGLAWPYAHRGVRMTTTIERYRHPWLFYGLSTVIPWACWLSAAYLSRTTHGSRNPMVAASVLGLSGLIAPTLVAFGMIWKDAELRRDISGRLFNARAIPRFYLLLACFLMLGSILLAQAISLLFGFSVNQFLFAGSASFSAGIFPAWFLLLLAPLIEELAWHTYGTDCLRSRMNLLYTSLVFAVYWAIWHMPLGLIKGYYHANVAASGLLYSLNFLVSVIPFVVLMNWLYYKTNRSVLVAIVFHVTAGVFNELFATHPASKVIQTGLLTCLAVVVVVRDKDLFLRRAYAEPSQQRDDALLTQ
jgi:membrane protease YdiL (CAAX protease family)